MTDTAREAAIERVRAYVDAWSELDDDWVVARVGLDNDRFIRITLGDLRLLLQPSEAPVTADEGWRDALQAATVATGTPGEFPVIYIEFGPEDYQERDTVFDFLTAAPAPPTGEGEPQPKDTK